MTLRTKSKSGQWTVWLCAALALLAVYVVLSRVLFNSVTWDLFDPRLHRLAIPLVAFFFYMAWNTRWDGIRRGKREEGKGKREEGEKKLESGVGVGERNLASGAAVPLTGGRGTARPTAGQHNEKPDFHSSTPDFDSQSVFPQPQPSISTSSLSGEDLFAQARALPHRQIPDFKNDAEYLDLLGKSASKGYSPALAKLGEYAMRRCAWVEAYYWMKQAQRNGMHGLLPTLRVIRKNWTLDGFPRQLSNANRLFTLEAGSIGRALLRVDSGHEAAKAREFLKANHPEFLT